MVIVSLLAAGVGLALDAYAERHASSSKNDSGTRKRADTEYRGTGYETGIISSDKTRKQQEEDAFKELQNYADFQKVLSSKVLDDLSKENLSSGPYNLTFPHGNKCFFPHASLHPASPGSLPSPIIISQQDIGDGLTTWGRTFAPELMYCGIDQSTFLSFLDSFNESIESSPLLDVTNVAALESGSWRNARGTLWGLIPLAVGITKSLQHGDQSNTFLTNANRSLFAPRGLFAMIITFQPDNLSSCITIDSTQPAHSARLENSPTSFYSTIDPELRPLEGLETPSASRPSSKFRKMSNFIADYGERRFQARNPLLPHFYAQQNERPLFEAARSRRETKQDSPKRRRRKGGNTSSFSRPKGLLASAIEGAFSNDKNLGTPSWADSEREIRGRMDHVDMNGQDNEEVEIQPGVLYLVIVNDPGGDEAAMRAAPIFDFPFEMTSQFGQGKGKEVEGFGPSVIDSNGTEHYSLDDQLPGHDMEWDGAPPEYTPRGGWQ